MTRPTTLVATVSLAALALSTALAAPALAADEGFQRSGEDVAAAAPGDLDWFFRELGAGGTVQYQDLGTYDAVDWPLVCDDGNGDHPSAWSRGQFELGGTDGASVRFGSSEDFPLCGDWDGDGVDTPGVVRGNVFHLAGSNRDGGAPVTSFALGRVDDFPLVGDWDGNGTDTVVLARGNTYLFASANVAGGGRVSSSPFGRADDFPVAASFDGTDVDTLALQRGNQFFVTFDRPGGSAPTVQETVVFGRVGDFPLAGRLGGSARASVGVLRIES